MFCNVINHSGVQSASKSIKTIPRSFIGRPLLTVCVRVTIAIGTKTVWYTSSFLARESYPQKKILLCIIQRFCLKITTNYEISNVLCVS